MAKIEFVHKAGPFGDETSVYDVITDAKTVGEFIPLALEKDNHGEFCITKEGGLLSKDEVCVASFFCKKINRKAKEYDAYLKCEIESIMSNGGWGMMRYAITVKKESDVPKQSMEEFLYVCFGHS